MSSYIVYVCDFCGTKTSTEEDADRLNSKAYSLQKWGKVTLVGVGFQSKQNNPQERMCCPDCGSKIGSFLDFVGSAEPAAWKGIEP